MQQQQQPQQQRAAPAQGGAQAVLASLQVLAKRLEIVQATKETFEDCASALKDIRERTAEISHLSIYPNFLKLILPRVERLLQKVPAQLAGGPQHEVRNVSLQILNRLPHNEALRPAVMRLLSVCVSVLEIDNEENALVALSIIADLVKVYQPNADEATLQVLCRFVGKLYSQLERSIAKHLPGQTPSSPQSAGLTPIQRPAYESFKVVGEIPVNLIFFLRLRNSEFGAFMTNLLPHMVRSISVRPRFPLASDAHACDMYRQLVVGQVKTLSFLTYLIRSSSYKTRLRDFQNEISQSVVGLLRACPPQAVSTRKELLNATRHILATDFRSAFFGLVDQFLDESVLLGGSYWIPPGSINSNQALGAHPLVAAREQPLMPLAYSTLADLIHHVRTGLSMQQLSKVIYIFSRNIHDASMPLAIQSTSVRLLLNLVDSIFHNKEPERNESRPLLVHILHTIVQKFGSLRHYIPEVVQAEKRRHEARQRSVTKSRKTSPIPSYYYFKASRPAAASSASAAAEATDTSAEGDIDIIHVEDDGKGVPAGANGLEPSFFDMEDEDSEVLEADCIKDLKSLVGTMMLGLKTVLWCVCNYGPKKLDRDIKSGAPVSSSGSQPSYLSGLLDPAEMEMVANLLQWGFQCLPVYRNGLLEEECFEEVPPREPTTKTEELHKVSSATASELEIVHQFAEVFTVLDPHDFADLFRARMPLLVANLVRHPTLIAFPKRLLRKNSISHSFMWILLEFVIEHFTLMAGNVMPSKKQLVCGPDLSNITAASPQLLVYKGVPMAGVKAAASRAGLGLPSPTFAAPLSAGTPARKPDTPATAAASTSTATSPSFAASGASSPAPLVAPQATAAAAGGSTTPVVSTPRAAQVASPRPVLAVLAGAGTTTPAGKRKATGISGDSSGDEDVQAADTEPMSPLVNGLPGTKPRTGRKPYADNILEEGVQHEANLPSIIAQLVEILLNCVENYTEDTIAGPAPASLGSTSIGRGGASSSGDPSASSPSLIGGLTPGWIIAGNMQARIEKLMTLCFVLAPHMTSAALSPLRTSVHAPHIARFVQWANKDKANLSLVNQIALGNKFPICASSQGRDCYLMTLRSLMRVIARRPILQELFKTKIQHMLVPALRALAQLLAQARGESKCSRNARADLVAEVVLLFAVRVPRNELPAYTPILQNAFETALAANDHRNKELVRLALRILESWVDSLGPEDFDGLFLRASEAGSGDSPTFAHAIAKLLQPSPQPCGTGALRVLGKMGTRARLALLQAGPTPPLRSKTALERALVVEMHWAVAQQGQGRGGNGAKLQFCLDQVARSACAFLHETHQPELGVEWAASFAGSEDGPTSPVGLMSPKRARHAGALSSAMATLAASGARSPLQSFPTIPGLAGNTVDAIWTGVGTASATHTPVQRALYTPVSALGPKHRASQGLLASLEDAEYYKQKAVQLLFACVAHMLDTSDLSDLPLAASPPHGLNTLRAFIEEKMDKVPFYQTPSLAASEGVDALKLAQRGLLVEALFGLAEASCDNQMRTSTWPLLQGILEFVVVAAMASSVRTRSPTSGASGASVVVMDTGATVTGVSPPGASAAHPGRRRASSLSSEDPGDNSEGAERVSAPAVIGAGVDATVGNEVIVRMITTACPAHTLLALIMIDRLASTIALALNVPSLDAGNGPAETAAEPILRDLVERLSAAAAKNRWESRLGACIGLRHLVAIAGAKWIASMQAPILDVFVLALETHHEPFGIDVFFHALTGLQEVLIACHLTSEAASATPPPSSSTSTSTSSASSFSSSSSAPASTASSTAAAAASGATSGTADSAEPTGAGDAAGVAPKPTTEASSSAGAAAREDAEKEATKKAACSAKALLQLLRSQYHPSRQAGKRAFTLLARLCHRSVGELIALDRRGLSSLRQLLLSHTVRKRTSGMQVVILDALAFLLDQEPCSIDLQDESMRKRIIQTMADAIVLVDMAARPSSERSYVVCLEYNSRGHTAKAAPTSFASSEHTPGCLHAGQYAFPDVPRSVALRVVAVDLMRACLTRGSVGLLRHMDAAEQSRTVRDRAIKLVITSALSSWPCVSRAAQNGLQIVEKLSRERLSADPQDTSMAVPSQVVAELLRIVTRSIRTTDSDYTPASSTVDLELSPSMLQGTLAIVEAFKSQPVISTVATSLIAQLRSILMQAPSEEPLSLEGELRTERKLVGLDLASEILRVLSHFPERNIMDNLKMVVMHVLRLETAAQRLTVERMFSSTPAAAPNTVPFFRIPGHLSSPMKEPLQLICHRFPPRVIKYLLSEMVHNKDLVRLCKQLLAMPQAVKLRLELLKPEHTSRLITSMLSLGSGTEKGATRQEHVVLAFYAVDIIHTVMRYYPSWLAHRVDLYETLLSIWRDKRLMSYLRQEEQLSWRQREFYSNMCDIFMAHFRHATKVIGSDVQRRDATGPNGASPQTTKQIEHLLVTAAAVPFELLTLAAVRTTGDSAVLQRFFRNEVAQNPVMDIRLAVVRHYVHLMHHGRRMGSHIKEAALRFIIVPTLANSRASRPFHTSRIDLGDGHMLGEELVREIIASVPGSAQPPRSPAPTSPLTSPAASSPAAPQEQNAPGGGSSAAPSPAQSPNPAQSSKATGADPNANDPARSSTVPQQLLQKIRQPPQSLFEATPSSQEALQVQMLKLSTLLIANYSEELEPLRKDLIKFAWNHLKNDDSPSKPWAYVNICTFIKVYRTPSDIILQVFVALLREHSSESRDLVRKSLDLLVPALAKRLKVQKYTRAIRWTKKLAADESHKLVQLTHIWQLVASHPELFYQNRQHFLPQIVASLVKLLLVPPSLSHRTLAVDLAELFLRWELTRDAEEAVWEAASKPTVKKEMPRTASGAAAAADAKSDEPAASEELSLRITAAKDSARGFRSNPPMVTAVLSFLVRASALLAESKEPEASALRRRCLHLIKQNLDFAARLYAASHATRGDDTGRPGASPTSAPGTPRRQWVKFAFVAKQIEQVVKKQKERGEQAEAAVKSAAKNAAAASASGAANAAAKAAQLESAKDPNLTEEKPGTLYCILEILDMVILADGEAIAEPFLRENAKYLRGLVPAVFGCAERGAREKFLAFISHLRQVMPIPVGASASSPSFSAQASPSAATTASHPATAAGAATGSPTAPSRSTSMSLSAARPLQTSSPGSRTKSPTKTASADSLRSTSSTTGSPVRVASDSGFYAYLSHVIEERLLTAADDGKTAVQEAMQNHQHALLLQQQKQAMQNRQQGAGPESADAKSSASKTAKGTKSGAGGAAAAKKTAKGKKVNMPSKLAHQRAARAEALRKAKELGAGPKGTLQTLQLIQVMCSRDTAIIRPQREGVMDVRVDVDAYNGKLVDRFMNALMKIMNKFIKELVGLSTARAKAAVKTAASLGGSPTLFVSVPLPPDSTREYSLRSLCILLEVVGSRALCFESHRRQYLLHLQTLLDKLDAHDELVLIAIVKQCTQWIAATPFPAAGKRKAAAEPSVGKAKSAVPAKTGGAPGATDPSAHAASSVSVSPSKQHTYVDASAAQKSAAQAKKKSASESSLANKLSTKERQQLLIKLEQLERFDGLPQARELMRLYRDLLMRVFDPHARDERSKIGWVQQMWPRVVAGLMSHDVQQRKQHFQLFASQQFKSKGPYAKLQVLIRQDWSHMAEQNWIPAALQILMSALHPSSFVDGGSTCQLRIARYSVPGADASPAAGRQVPLLGSLRRTLSALRRLKTSGALVEPLQELAYGDRSVETARVTWTEVFPQAWRALEEQQKMVMTEGFQVLLSRGYHLPHEVTYFGGIQRCAVIVQHALEEISSLVTLSKARKVRLGIATDPFQEILQAFALRRVSTWTLLAGWHQAPNIVQVLMEGLVLLRPLPILLPEVLSFVGNHLGHRHLAIELSELLGRQLHGVDRDLASRGLPSGAPAGPSDALPGVQLESEEGKSKTAASTTGSSSGGVPSATPDETSQPRKKQKKSDGSSATTSTNQQGISGPASGVSALASGSAQKKKKTPKALDKDGKRKKKKDKKDKKLLLVESATAAAARAAAKPGLDRVNANRWTRTLFDLYRRDNEDMMHGIIRSCCTAAPTFAGLAHEASSSWQFAQRTYLEAIRRSEAGDGSYLVARAHEQARGSPDGSKASQDRPAAATGLAPHAAVASHEADMHPIGTSNLASMDLFDDDFGGMLDDLANDIGLDAPGAGPSGTGMGDGLDPLMLDGMDAGLSFGLSSPRGEANAADPFSAGGGDPMSLDHQTEHASSSSSTNLTTRQGQQVQGQGRPERQYIWVPAPVSSLEMEFWYKSWETCAAQLGQWEEIRDLAVAKDDAEMMLESFARVPTPNWTGKVKPLIKQELEQLQQMHLQVSQDRPYLPSHLHPNLLRVRPAILNISLAINEDKSAQEVDHIWRQSANALLLDWATQGACGGVGRRRDLLLSCQRLVELEESVVYLSHVIKVAGSLKSAVASGPGRPLSAAGATANSSSSSSLQRSASTASAASVHAGSSSTQKSHLINRLLHMWRERAPSPCEDPKDWDELLCSRLSVFKLGTRIFEDALKRSPSAAGSTGATGGAHLELQPAQMQILAASHDTRWTILERAKVYRKRGMVDESLGILSSASLADQRGTPEESFIILRERVLNALNCENSLAFVDRKKHLASALSSLLEVDMSGFGVENRAELLRLRAAVQEGLNDGSQIVHSLFAHSVHTHSHASSWLDWALYADRLICAEEADEMRSYPFIDRDLCTILTGSILQAIKHGSAEARSLLPKVLWRLQAEALCADPLEDPINVADAASLSSVANSITMHLPMLPTWVWLPWTSQLVAMVPSGSSQVVEICKQLLALLGREYPNAVYFTLRSYYFGKDSQRKRMAAARSNSVSTPTGTMDRQNSSADGLQASATSPSAIAGDGDASVRAASELKTALALFHNANGRFCQEAETLIEELSFVVKRHDPLEEMHSTIHMLLEKCIQVSSSQNVQADLVASSMEVAADAVLDPEAIRMFQMWQMLERLCTKMFSEQNVARSEQHKELITRLRKPFEEDFQPDPAQLAALRRGEVPVVGRSVGGREMSYAAIIMRVGRWKAMLTDALYATQESQRTLTQLSRALATMVPETLHIPGMHMLKDGLREPSLSNHPQLAGFDPRVYFRRDSGFSQPGLGFRSATGRVHHFIIKASPLNYTEADQRAVQLKVLLNDMLDRANSSVRRGRLQLELPVVVPIHARLALQADSPGTKSLSTLFEDSMRREGVAHAKVAAASYLMETLYGGNESASNGSAGPTALADKKNKKKSGAAGSGGGASSKSGTPKADTASRRADAFARVCEVIPDYLLSNHLRAQAQEAWHMLVLRDSMVGSLALSSFLSHMLSTGHQSPSRQLLREDMALVNVEFRPGYSPDGRGDLLNDGAQVPFRLTRNLEHLMTPAGVQGRFANILTAVSTCVVDEPVNRAALRAFLESYLFDDLQVMFKYPESTNVAPSDLYRKLRRNLNVVDARLDSFSARKVEEDKQEASEPPVASANDVERQVKVPSGVAETISPKEPVAGDHTVARLIAEATDTGRLAKLDATWLPWF